MKIEPEIEPREIRRGHVSRNLLYMEQNTKHNTYCVRVLSLHLRS
jgi:endonuclease I